MNAALPSMTKPAFERLAAVLRKLARTPPQVLLLEGGREDERADAARYGAACCNCPRSDANGAPCLACPACRQIMAGEYPDMYLYDGRIRNKEDQENPGIVRAFTVENTRILRRKLHDMPPHGEGRRVVVITGIDQNRDEAANAMLKLLEDPLPGTVFILLTPQREQLLPTLVSRSFCLTLPWPDIHAGNNDTAAWEKKLADFLREGRGFLEDVAARGAVDALSAENLLVACQKACGEAFSQKTPSDGSDMALKQVFSALDTRRLTQAVKWIFEAQEALRQNVTPARVLEALAARLFVLRAQKT
ncbi:MAG: DNA polymerase III subunit delta' [Desulfovibrio sp.]|jgi:DNA polymerase-3 subunit delta'|nr:DNA polymerase III subunit delta' [Desulfovibrio sp.]